jgi:hypothetical protein
MRIMAWAFAIAIILVVIGLTVSTMAPGGGGEIVAMVGFVILGVLVVAVYANAVRSRGWTRVVNPGAARREYRAEQAAKQRGHAKDEPER